MERIPTGIEKLDGIISGGYPKEKSILITGAPGTGKTIFGLHLLYKSCNDDKKCMLIATEEMPEDILIEAEILGLDIRSYYDSGQLIIERVFESRTENIEQAATFGAGLDISEIGILERIRLVPDDIEVLIIDNIGVFALDLTIKDLRNTIDTINRILIDRGCTTIFIMDEAAYELTHRLAEYSVYGSIKLMVKENPYTNKRERYLDIPKMRGTDISLELHTFNITPKGIMIHILGT